MGATELFNFRVEHPLPLDALAQLILAKFVVVAQLHFERIVTELQRKVRDRDADIAAEAIQQVIRRATAQQLEPLESVDQLLLTRLRKLVPVREAEPQVSQIHFAASVFLLVNKCIRQ